MSDDNNPRHVAQGSAWVYRRADGYVHMVVASSETTARRALASVPGGFVILGEYQTRYEAQERIDRERHADLR